METPKTFKELFANTGIEPTTDESGNTHYNFKATLKEKPKQETLEETLTAEEFFRNKIKENIEWEGEITLWKVPLNAELSMRWAKEYSDYVIKWQQQQMYSEEELLAFGKSCFYKGFEKAEKDDVNCYTAFREEIGSLVEQFKNK
jgi:hypothetical protein